MSKPSSYITATHVVYYHLCHRKLWLFHHQIQMEYTSEAVAVGKHIEQYSYQKRAQRWKAFDLGYIKIDHFDSKTKQVKEVKKSPKLEFAHIAQVQYYLFELEKAGVEEVTGLIEYPQQRQTTTVVLDTEIRQEVKVWINDITQITNQADCPPLQVKPYCRKCAYRDFCFI